MKLKNIIIKLIIILIVLIPIVFFAIGKIKNGIINSRITDVSKLVRDRASKHYVNDLYISDGRYYEYILNSNEKKLYDDLYNSILKRDKEVLLDMSEFNFSKDEAKSIVEKEMKRVLDTISMDHPEIIYYSPLLNTFEFNSDSKIIHMDLEYSMSEKEYNQNLKTMQESIDYIKSKTKSMTDFEKVRYVYKWICDKNVFGEEGLLSHSAYASFDTKEVAVCESMAKASQIIFQNIGINSVIVIGKRLDTEHEWNAVKLNEDWYYYDSNMGLSGKTNISDQVVNYEFFLFNDNKKYNQYIVYYRDLLPKINGSKYIRENGMYW